MENLTCEIKVLSRLQRAEQRREWLHSQRGGIGDTSVTEDKNGNYSVNNTREDF